MEGWRAFRLLPIAGRLTLGAVWSALEFRGYPAGCSRCGRHDAPEPTCECGYYAFKGLSNLLFHLSSDVLPVSRSKVLLVARVWGYGKVIEHDLGWRAEKMRIEELHYYPELCLSCRDLFCELAGRWHVPFVIHQDGEIAKVSNVDVDRNSGFSSR